MASSRNIESVARIQVVRPGEIRSGNGHSVKEQRFGIPIGNGNGHGLPGFTGLGDIRLTDGRNRYLADGVNTQAGVNVALHLLGTEGLPEDLTRGAVHLDDRPGQKHQIPVIETRNWSPEVPRMYAWQARRAIEAYADKPPERLDLTSPDINGLVDRANTYLRENVYRLKRNKDKGKAGIGFGNRRPFPVPNPDRYRYQLFPKDTLAQSLADSLSPKRRDLQASALEKLAFVWEKYGIIPVSTTTTALNVPASPTYLSIAHRWYMNHPDKDSHHVKAQFKRFVKAGAQEHGEIWNNVDPERRGIGQSHAAVPEYKWLRLAGDLDTQTVPYHSMQTSGWDAQNSRGGGSDHELLMVDVNSLLSRDKRILAFAAKLFNEPIEGHTAEEWDQIGDEMDAEMLRVNLNTASGALEDVNYKTGKPTNVVTLASASGLLAGVLRGADALSTIGQLTRLGTGRGLITTAVEDRMRPITDADLSTLDPRSHGQVKSLHEPQNWDAKLFALEQWIAIEGMTNYVTRPGMGLTLRQRLAIAHFATEQAQDQVKHQLGLNGFKEKLQANGEPDMETHHYEPQSGLSASAALPKAEIRVYLPTLYACADEIQAAIDRGEPEDFDLDLTYIMANVIQEAQAIEAASEKAAEPHGLEKAGVVFKRAKTALARRSRN